MGQKQAAYDDSGIVVAFYDSVDSPAPEGAKVVAISDAQWAEMLAGQTRGKRLAIDKSGQPQLLAPLSPTKEQILALNTSVRNELLERASIAMAPMQMAVSLGEATDDEKAMARQWVTFTRAVKAVDLTAADPVWPAKQEIAGSN